MKLVIISSIFESKILTRLTFPQSLNYDTVENDLTLQSETKREYKVC